VDAIAKAGHPVVRIALADKYNLGQEMFRWEIATAVAGSVIGINTFNQPDVEASKVATRKLTSEYEKSGSLPPESPILSDSGIDLYTDEANASALASAAGNDKTLAGYLRAHLSRIKAGDYFALLAYIQMNDPHEEALQKMRRSVRDTKRVATCLGFGPRFLHSTGQAYKGGPNSGVFLQITCNDKADSRGFPSSRGAASPGAACALARRGGGSQDARIRDYEGVIVVEPWSLQKRGQHATRNDRTRKNGRQYGSPPDTRRTQMRRV
jgi:transaldolase/glucose-6-phosphate isomerase